MRRLFLFLSFFCLLIFTYDCRSAKTQTEFSAPLEIVDNRPFVKVEIKGKTLYFIVDTGAINAIEAERAAELGLKEENRFQTGGVGNERVEAWTTTIETYKVGDREFPAAQFTAIPLKNIKEGLKLPYLDGILGYGFFRNFALQIDYPNKTVRFLNDYEGRNGVPFTMQGSSIPRVKTQIDNIPTEFIIDTGDRSELTLSKNVFDQLAGQYPLSEEKITGYGIGGPVYAKTFNLNNLQVGETGFKNVLTRIPTNKSGAFARNDFLGSIGSGLLKKYKLTVNYRTNILYLE